MNANHKKRRVMVMGVGNLLLKGEVERLAEDIIEKKTDPSTAAAEILENVFNHIRRAP
ncbi:MAG: hypothetical protein Q8O43_00315 [Dehalococcoidia bacterium]|nr:hypothetical protein [Dehalococcoidia bacterium]